ncbi:MAG TPA: hypothetical protein VK178_03565 [Opitutaceae bacterium]|nr:hypothetical protein [Opitutaceae bacterium]
MLRVLAVLLAILPLGLRAAPTTDAFAASPDWPAAFVPRLKPADAASDVLRVLTVEERVGEARADELVRVPLFLHEDEPNDPARWALYAENDTARRQPLVFQLDDLRHDEAGRLTRCHLYFAANLAAWERQRFVLVARRETPATETAPPAAVTATRKGDRVTLAGQDLALTFFADGPRAGALTAIAPRGHIVELPDGWIAPRLTLVRQALDCSELRRSTLDYAEPDELEVREVRWGAGPLFATFAVRFGPRGQPDSAEFTYRVPLKGALFVQTERLAPEGEPTSEAVGAADHQLLAGRLRLAGSSDSSARAIPAGLRKLTRATSGHTLTALVAAGGKSALLAVPAVQTGGGEIETGRGGAFSVAGAETFRRNKDGNSGTLRAFWGELRYVFTGATDDEALWHEARRQLQPLVAIVDEPTLGPAEVRAAMPAVAQRFREIQSWSRQWPQDAALLQLERDGAKLAALLARKPALAEGEPTFHLPQWAKPEPMLPRDAKDQGRIDPYQLGYGSSVIPLLDRLSSSPKRPAAAHAIGLATRRAFGRVNAAGFPYVDCFATAFNMQIGPLGLALFGARGTDDPQLASWALDALHSPSVTAMYGHGQRAYPGETRRPEPSDFLYAGICEFHLRSIELATGEDLWIHPAAIGRYFDCVDVTADLQHHVLPGGRGKSWYRANFFRGQAHDHRWENWSAAPLVGLFARAADRGQIGSTEAAYWVDQQSRTKQPWAELMWFAHTDLLLELIERLPAAQSAPALPADVSKSRAGGANRLRWSPVAGAIGYRVYRAKQVGGPWVWLNSPYAKEPTAPLTTTEFTDSEGREGDSYLVTAVDAAGRESRWYAEEPKRR